MINKKKYLLILLFLLIIAIPVSFADDNITGEAVGQNTLSKSDVQDNNVSDSSDNNEILGAGEVYFDASASSGGDGSQSKPYNTVTSSNLGTTNHFAPGTYRIASSLSPYSYDGISFIGENRDTTILQYTGSDTFITSSYGMTFSTITLKGCSIVSNGGSLTATNTVFDSGIAKEETESDNYKSSSIQTSFNVKPKDVPDVNTTLNVDVPSDSLNPVFTFNLPNATGNLTVTIGDKKYTKELVNGTATIAVDDLLPGSYNATVTYSGDKNHEGISKNTTFTVPTPKLTGKNVAVIYSAAASYKVLVTVNGKALAGEKVTVKFNGKTYSLTTDKNGYATLKLNTKVKVKKYTINVEYKGVKASNALTVKHLIKAKNIKAKKSKRVLKIKVSTNKVNGKFLKGKKLTLKVKGKTIKAKINKKGVATFKVKKSILNKLKVGKKYKYRVSYGKDAVTKKITVRR